MYSCTAPGLLIAAATSSCLAASGASCTGMCPEASRTNLAVIDEPKPLYIVFSRNCLNLGAPRMRDAKDFPVRIRPSRLRVITLPVRQAKGAVMPAALS